MPVQNLPRLMSVGHTIDTSPEHFGFLKVRGSLILITRSPTAFCGKPQISHFCPPTLNQTPPSSGCALLGRGRELPLTATSCLWDAEPITC